MNLPLRHSLCGHHLIRDPEHRLAPAYSPHGNVMGVGPDRQCFRHIDHRCALVVDGPECRFLSR